MYLARSPRLVRRRETLVSLLWGDRPEAAARHSLREAIRVIRRVAGEDVISAAGEEVELAGGAVVLDIDQVEEFARAGKLESAAALAGGELLEGFSIPGAPQFEDWLTAERLAARRLCTNVLGRAAEGAIEQARLDDAVEFAKRALAQDGAAEPAARSLIRALALAGDRAGALGVFERLSSCLRDLGAEPGSDTVRLVEQVRRQRAIAAAQQGVPVRAARRVPLIGRDAELAAALAVWALVRERAVPAVVVLDGDAGMGRTRLVDEIVSRARLDGGAIATARAVAADASSPWSGCLGLAGGGLLDAAGAGAAPGEALAAFAAVHEAWADRFPHARNLPPQSPGAALCAVARAAAAEQPVVLGLDDAHTLDSQTLRALPALARDCAGLPVLIVVAAATHPPREELDMLRSRTGRDIAGRVLSLGPLPQAALTALARWTMPAWDEPQLERLVRRVAADSAGIPLLAVEILNAVANGLDLGADAAWPRPLRTLDETLPGDLPPTITAAMRVGFGKLSLNTRTVLAAAAVVAERTDADMLQRATGLDSAAVAAALDEAEWQRWLVSDARGYTFLARLVRDVVARDMLTAGQRRRVLGAVRRDG